MSETIGRSVDTRRRGRIVATLPLLLLCAQAPERCEIGEPAEAGPIIALTAVGVGEPVSVEEGGMIAQETFRYAEPSWRTTEEIRLPAPDAVVFPAGTPVYLRTGSGDGESGSHQTCLPTFLNDSQPPPGARRRARAGGFITPCLVDSDGDGDHDAIERWSSPRVASHIPQDWLDSTVPLARPQRLAPDPVGRPESCRHASRFLRFSVIFDDTAWVDVSARTYACSADVPRPDPAFVEGGDGARVYQLPPSAPPLTERSVGSLTGTLAAERARIPLVDGAEPIIAGMPLRVARDGEGWTVTPLTAFPPWDPRGCD